LRPVIPVFAGAAGRDNLKCTLSQYALKYTLKIVTRYTGGITTLKTPRTILYELPLTAVTPQPRRSGNVTDSVSGIAKALCRESQRHCVGNHKGVVSGITKALCRESKRFFDGNKTGYTLNIKRFTATFFISVMEMIIFPLYSLVVGFNFYLIRKNKK
jgi:hypothetical protein